MRSYLTERLQSFKDYRRRGKKLPSNITIPKDVFYNHQDKVRERFEKYCIEFNITITIFYYETEQQPCTEQTEKKSPSHEEQIKGFARKEIAESH